MMQLRAATSTYNTYTKLSIINDDANQQISSIGFVRSMKNSSTNRVLPHFSVRWEDTAHVGIYQLINNIAKPQWW